MFLSPTTGEVWMASQHQSGTEGGGAEGLSQGQHGHPWGVGVQTRSKPVPSFLYSSLMSSGQ